MRLLLLKSAVFSRTCYSTVAKSLLATLRKETGYSIKNCKKALEIHNNIQEATKWLNDQAQKQGWEKATKLQNRVTAQGLIGVQVKDRTAALVEVCCETDFVARNTIFKDLVKAVTSACCVPEHAIMGKPFSEKALSVDQMNDLSWDGKKLTDHVAMAISQLGENILLRRGLLLHATPGLVLSTSVHPSTTETGEALTGTYGALVALKPLLTSQINEEGVAELGRQLCMHIIGMKPKYIQSKDASPQKAVVPKSRVAASAGGEDQECEDIQLEGPEEDSLLAQSYVFNPEMIVQDVLAEKGVEVVHFLRFERGEPTDASV